MEEMRLKIRVIATINNIDLNDHFLLGAAFFFPLDLTTFLLTVVFLADFLPALLGVTTFAGDADPDAFLGDFLTAFLMVLVFLATVFFAAGFLTAFPLAIKEVRYVFREEIISAPSMQLPRTPIVLRRRLRHVEEHFTTSLEDEWAGVCWVECLMELHDSVVGQISLTHCILNGFIFIILQFWYPFIPFVRSL